MRDWGGFFRDRQAAAALEFAAAGSVILILLLAVLEGGLLFMSQRGLDYGVYKAARWAAVNGGSVTTANVLAQFQSATSVTLGNSATCRGFSAGTSAPAGTACYITVSLSNQGNVGSVLTIQASYKWTPIGRITGFVATTLQSSIALPIVH